MDPGFLHSALGWYTVWNADSWINVFVFYRKCTHGMGHSWWHHQMEAFSALLAVCAGNSLFTSEFPSQMPVTRSFDIFFNLRLNKRLSIQSIRRRFETPSRSSWRHYNVIHDIAQDNHYEVIFSICYKRLNTNTTFILSMNKTEAFYMAPHITKNDIQENRLYLRHMFNRIYTSIFTSSGNVCTEHAQSL